MNQVAEIDNVVVLQAIRRANRQFELVHLLQQHRIKREIRFGLVGDALLGLLEIDEDLELVLQDARRVSDRIFRRYRAIRFNAHGELVIVEDLPFTGVLDFVRDLLHRAEQRIHRNQTNGRVFRPVAVGRHVAFA